MFNIKIKNKITNKEYEKNGNGKEVQDFLYEIAGLPNENGIHDSNFEFSINKVITVDDLNDEIQMKRRVAYPTIDQVVEALIEVIAEGRNTKLNEIQALRNEVKLKYPKV